MPFTGCISEINNVQVDNAKDLDVAMPMYNPVEYSANYVKISGSLWKFRKDDPNDNMTDSMSNSRLKHYTNNAGIANVEIALPLKYFSIF